MGVANEIFVVAIGILFNYMFLYRNNKFFGCMANVGLSLAIMVYSTGSIITATGTIMFFGSLINWIYVMMPTKKNKRSR